MAFIREVIEIADYVFSDIIDKVSILLDINLNCNHEQNCTNMHNFYDGFDPLKPTHGKV